MKAPECIITFFETLGLKTSEKKRLLHKIAASEKKIRSLNKNAEAIENDIKKTELQCREAQTEYDSLKGVARETACIRLENLRRQLQRYTERNGLLDQQLNAETLILQNLQLQLENLNSRSAEEIEEIKTEKQDLVAEQYENTKAAERLEKTTYSNTTDNQKDDFDTLFNESN